MSPQIPCIFSHISPPLRLHPTAENFSEFLNKYRGLNTQHVLRQIPGKSVQRRPGRGGLLRTWRRGAGKDTPRYIVVGMARTPVALCVLTSLPLAGFITTRTLPIAYTPVGKEPLTTIPAWLLARPLDHSHS